MNEVIQNILNRRSWRSYEDKQIKEEELEQIIRCGLWAPSAMNQQSWHFTVVQDKETIQRIRKGCQEMMETDRDMFYGAPTLVIVTGKVDVSFFRYTPTTTSKTSVTASPDISAMCMVMDPMYPVVEKPWSVSRVMSRDIPLLPSSAVIGHTSLEARFRPFPSPKVMRSEPEAPLPTVSFMELPGMPPVSSSTMESESGVSAL